MFTPTGAEILITLSQAKHRPQPAPCIIEVGSLMSTAVKKGEEELTRETQSPTSSLFDVHKSYGISDMCALISRPAWIGGEQR